MHHGITCGMYACMPTYLKSLAPNYHKDYELEEFLLGH